VTREALKFKKALPNKGKYLITFASEFSHPFLYATFPRFHRSDHAYRNQQRGSNLHSCDLMCPNNLSCRSNGNLGSCGTWAHFGFDLVIKLLERMDHDALPRRRLVRPSILSDNVAASLHSRRCLFSIAGSDTHHWV
jgi:hypothetical protein